jgi:hypothetical protein
MVRPPFGRKLIGGPGLDPVRLASITFRFEGSGALYLDDIGYEAAR